MSLYKSYLEEIEERKAMGLNPKPIDDESLTAEIIAQIKDTENEYREESLKYFIYNVLPGTTGAANVKAKFLKEIILGKITLEEISSDFALELLSHMKGGPSIEVLLDLVLDADNSIAQKASDVLKTQVFLYEADTERLKQAFASGNKIVKNIQIGRAHV
jgi:aconitate hydratase 2/2-methylisocitrate dehydratase